MTANTSSENDMDNLKHEKHIQQRQKRITGLGSEVYCSLASNNKIRIHERLQSSASAFVIATIAILL